MHPELLWLFMIEPEALASLRRIFPSLEWNMDELSSFLKAVGLMNPGGSLYDEREKKLHEIIHFSGHVIRCINDISRRKNVVLLDCGCGRSYLPFFLGYILAKMRRYVTYIGVDANPELIERSQRTSRELGLINTLFYSSNIIVFQPSQKVDIVSALHACDTATDEALAKGVKLNARFIIAAPCCQRQIVRQISHVAKKAPPLSSLLNSKVTKESLGIALTETLRKLALESFGYKVDMFEFVSPRHTPKNLMLRAEKTKEWNSLSLDAYHDLRDYFNVKPRIEEYLPQLK
jgi:hypothetical protein